MAANFRPYDVIVRFGGDEFLCFCSGLSKTDADARLALVNAELAPDGRSISMGVAELQPNDTATLFIARADRDLYRYRGEHRDGHRSCDTPDDQNRRSGRAHVHGA